MLRVLIVVCCQVEVSATSWSLVQRSPTDCGASEECDLETSILRRPWAAGGRTATKANKQKYRVSIDYALCTMHLIIM
jgi:hypothetical protein